MKKLKIPQKTIKRIKTLSQQEKRLCDEYKINIIKLQNEYSSYIDDFGVFQNMYSPKFDKKQLTEAHYDYLEDKSKIHAEFDKKLRIIQAKFLAHFLIATHIAQRGKYLHPDTAIHKLNKYSSGDLNRFLLNLNMAFALQSMPFLATELYNSYNVKLLNKDAYVKFSQYTSIYPDDKKTKKYENLLKKFHKQNTIQNNVLKQIDERPF